MLFFDDFLGFLYVLHYFCSTNVTWQQQNYYKIASMTKTKETLKRRLEVAEAKVSTLRDITREARTPLTLIITPLLSLMKEDHDPHRRGIYETIRRNSERLLSLIDQIIDISRLEMGEMQLHMTETDLIGYIDNVMKMFTQIAKAKMTFLNFYHDMEHLPAWIDRRNFDKVLVNLMANAFKYTAVGGTIDIRVEQDKEHIYIYMQDNGVGIPESQLPYVFNRFYDAQLSLVERNITTGIRLDLIHRLVSLHHGTIEVRNNEKGGGCEFKITLQQGCKHLSKKELSADMEEGINTHLLLEDELQMNIATIDNGKKKQHRQRIVLIESEEDVSDFLVNELKNDYDVTLCNTGQKGIAAIGTTNPDMVISDVNLFDMEGHAICSRIKSNSATNHIPFILLTNNDPNIDRLELLEAAADAYIMRPFNMDILRRTIVNLLHRQETLKLKFGRKDQLEDMVDDVNMKSPDEKLLERIMTVINSNLSNMEISIEQIADSVGISRVHLHRKMKELTGQTPHDFIRGIRLKKAAQLLRKGDMSITEVVYACGFGSAASFSTIFKKQYGVAPREYMNNVRSEK